jgi:hypothetical protein
MTCIEGVPLLAYRPALHTIADSASSLLSITKHALRPTQECRCIVTSAGKQSISIGIHAGPPRCYVSTVSRTRVCHQVSVCLRSSQWSTWCQQPTYISALFALLCPSILRSLILTEAHSPLVSLGENEKRRVRIQKTQNVARSKSMSVSLLSQARDPHRPSVSHVKTIALFSIVPRYCARSFWISPGKA